MTLQPDYLRKRIYIYNGVQFVIQAQIQGGEHRYYLITDVDNLERMVVDSSKHRSTDEVGDAFAIRRGFGKEPIAHSTPDPASAYTAINQAIDHACFLLLLLRAQKVRQADSRFREQDSPYDKFRKFIDEGRLENGYLEEERDRHLHEDPNNLNRIVFRSVKFHEERSAELLAEAQEKLRRNSIALACENAWGAVAHCVRAISERKGWDHNKRSLINVNAMKLLSAEPVDRQAVTHFLTVWSLQNTFYEDWVEPLVADIGIKAAEQVIRTLENQYPHPRLDR